MEGVLKNRLYLFLCFKISELKGFFTSIFEGSEKSLMRVTDDSERGEPLERSVTTQAEQ